VEVALRLGRGPLLLLEVVVPYLVPLVASLGLEVVLVV
jgi:hypothetical protein